MRSALLLVLMAGAAAACGPGRISGRRRGPRKLTPLVFGQHVPNVSENAIAGSGLAEGRITRTDEKFKDLVPNYNPDIIFKDEEGTGADRLMTQRCKEKLNTLAISVMNQWPGVRLRVTEGWEEEDRHLPESLHYEGRAVDLTTSDRDRSKYGMLARLAVEAGFDWVYYESRSYIHCSVRTESSVGAGSGCFPAGSKVTTPSGEKDIAELRPGDSVLAADSQGNLIFSEVITFLDREENSTRQYVEITTEGGVTLHATPGHLVMLANPEADTWREQFAGIVKPGDSLLINTNDKVLKRVTVTSTKLVLKKGVYAPLTKDGTLVVDGALASCYALIRSHALAHAVLAPLRWFSFGSDKSGVHWYARTLYSASRYILPTSYTYR